MARRYLIETFGCQMNVHDSERMAGLLEQAGYERTGDEYEADVIVLNTCSVRERAEEKLYSRLGELRQVSRRDGGRPVVAVAGCVAQQEADASSSGPARPTSSSGPRQLDDCPRSSRRRAGRLRPRSTSIRTTTSRSPSVSPGGAIPSKRM